MKNTNHQKKKEFKITKNVLGEDEDLEGSVPALTNMRICASDNV